MWTILDNIGVSGCFGVSGSQGLRVSWGREVSGYQDLLRSWGLGVSYVFIAMSMSPQQLLLLMFMHYRGLRVSWGVGVSG